MQPDIKAVATDHKDLIHDVSYDFYGDRLATCSSDQTVKIWEKEDSGEWQKTAEIKGHSGSVWRVSWAHPEFGSVLATCSFDRTAAIWEELVSVAGDSHTNKVWSRRYLCVDSRSSVTDAKFSPKHLGLVLATSSCDGIVRIYEAPDVMNLACWTVMLEINVKMSCSSLSWCTSTATHPLIAVGCDDTKPENNGKVVLFSLAENLSNFTKIGSIDSVKEPVQDVVFAPNLGRSYNLLAIASKGITLIKLKSSSEGDGPLQFEQTQIVTSHEKPVWRLSWNVTGTALASTTDDGIVRVWKSNYLGEWRCNPVLKDGAVVGERWGSAPPLPHLSTHSEDDPAKPSQAQTKRNSGWPYFNTQKDQSKHYY